MEFGSIRSDERAELGLGVARGMLGLYTGTQRVASLKASIASAERSAPVGLGGWSRDGTKGYSAGGQGMTVEASPAAAACGLAITWSIRNTSHEPVRLLRFEVSFENLVQMRWADGLLGLKIAYCGAHSRSRHSRSGIVPLEAKRAERSWWVGAVAGRKGGPGLVVGALDFRRFATWVDLSLKGVVAGQALEQWVLEPAEQVDLAPLWIAFSPSAPLASLEAYADEVGRRHGSHVRQSPCGWGSWGHYLESIDADLMRENLLALEGSTRLREVVRVVQIDDGWSELLDSQRASASWLPNRRFPSGIAPVAGQVQASGKECGLWILPFTVNDGSPLAETHPEYLVRDEEGWPKRVGSGHSFCLDATHPGARAWLTDLLTRVTDWGVSYLKLDFLRALLMPDPDTSGDDLEAARVYCGARTRVEAYRRGLELVREAVGDKVFLVGCSAPAGPSVGLIDALRVGPDIEPAWIGKQSGIRDAVRCLAANWFWQGRAWVNDPDYLLATSSVEESRFWVTAVALSGGSAIISADLGEMAAWQEELFAMATPPLGRAARPVDLFGEGPEPRLWHLPLEQGGASWHLVGLFNWDDSPGEMSVDLATLGLQGPAHVWDVWRRTHRVGRRRTVFFVEARAASLLSVRSAIDRPQLVGTDVHFAQGPGVIDGERWDATRRTLRLDVSSRLPRPGVAYVWMPPGWRCLDGGSTWGVQTDLVRCRLARGRAVELTFEERSSS